MSARAAGSRKGASACADGKRHIRWCHLLGPGQSGSEPGPSPARRWKAVSPRAFSIECADARRRWPRQRPSHATRGPCRGAAGGRASPRRRGPSLSGTRGGPWPSVLASGAIDRLGVGLDADAGRCVRPARHMRRPAGCLGARGGRRDRLLAPACVLALVSLKPRLYYVASTSAFKNPCHIAYMRIDHLSPLLEQDRVQTK